MTMPCASIAWSSAKLAESPSDRASRPGDCGVISRRARIGAAHDQRERVERTILDAIDFEKGIEAAQLAVMRERLSPGDVIGRGARLRRDVKDAFGRDEQEFGFRIDEAPDQPGTGDPIDLGGARG